MILQEGFEERAMEYIMLYVDPVIYTFWGIALTLFVLSTYKKPELRGFYLTFGLILLAGILQWMGLTQMEAASIFISGGSCIFSLYYYRIKSNNTMEV